MLKGEQIYILYKLSIYQKTSYQLHVYQFMKMTYFQILSLIHVLTPV